MGLGIYLLWASTPNLTLGTPELMCVYTGIARTRSSCQAKLPRPCEHGEELLRTRPTIEDSQRNKAINCLNWTMPCHLGNRHVVAPLSQTRYATLGGQVAIQSVQPPRHASSTSRPSVPVHDVLSVGHSIHSVDSVAVAVPCPSQARPPCCSSYATSA